MSVNKDKWENDPSLLPQSAARDKKAEEGAWIAARASKVPAKTLFRRDPEQLKRYEAWLKKNPKA